MIKKKNTPSLSPGEIRQLLLPLLVLYSLSYGLILQSSIDEHSKLMLIIQLAVGALILGVYPAYRIHKDFNTRIWITIQGLDWLLLTFSVASAFLMLFLYHYIYLFFPGFSSSNFFLYYGLFSYKSPIFFIVLPLMVVYVFTEELFFRGLLYQRLKKTFGFVIALCLATAIFVVSHLYWGIFLPVLAALSFFTIVLFEKSKTIFYGFVMHAVLNVSAMAMATEEFREIFFAEALLKFYLFLAIVIICGIRIFFPSESTTGKYMGVNLTEPTP